MEITLTPDIERALLEQAQRQGTTPESLALESLRQQFVHRAEGSDATGPHDSLADFLEGYIGVLHSGEYVSCGARMSEATGDAFAEALIEQRRQGRFARIVDYRFPPLRRSTQ